MLRQYFLLMSFVLLSFSAQAATLKIATVVPDGTNWMNQFRAAAKEVNSKTEGRVKLKFFPGGVMGSDKSVLRKMRIGQLQGGALGIGALSGFYKGSALYSLPFLFKNLDEVQQLRSYIDPILEKELDKKGIVLLSVSEGGFAKIMSDVKVSGPKSLQGKKVWIPEGDVISQSVFNEAGVSPTALPISDVYTGLQTGLIDTVTINPSAAIALQWHTKIKHVADEPVVFVMGCMAVDKRAFKRISAADQNVVKEAVKAAFKRLDESNKQDDKNAEAALKALGVNFTPMGKEYITQWQNHANVAVGKMVEKNEMPAELLKSVRAKLSAIRSKQAQ